MRTRPELRLVPKLIDGGELARQLRHEAMTRERERRRARIVCLSVVGSLLFASVVGPIVVVLVVSWLLGVQ